MWKALFIVMVYSTANNYLYPVMQYSSFYTVVVPLLLLHVY